MSEEQLEAVVKELKEMNRHIKNFRYYFYGYVGFWVGFVTLILVGYWVLKIFG